MKILVIGSLHAMTCFWVMPGSAPRGVALLGLGPEGGALVTLERAQAPQYGADVKHAPA